MIHILISWPLCQSISPITINLSIYIVMSYTWAKGKVYTPGKYFNYKDNNSMFFLNSICGSCLKISVFHIDITGVL